MALSQVPQELMSQVPAGANPVDALAAPGGGYWVMGADGGVFSVGGAPFLGAYTQLENQDPNRRFTHLISNGTGYTQLSAKNELYQFLGKPIEKEETPAVPTVDGDKTDEKLSAKTWMKDQLAKVGLGELGEWALGRFNELGGTAGAADAVLIEMRDRDEYTKKYPAMKLRAKAGLAPITEGQYMEWKDKAGRALMNAGLPSSFYDGDDDFTSFIAGDVSVPEIEDRVKNGYKAAMAAPPEVRGELNRLFGISEQGLAAFFLDPSKAEKIWGDALAQSQLSGAATMQHFGGLSQAEAQGLQERGVGFEEAQADFGLLSTQTELFGVMDAGETEFTREQQLGVVGNDEAAKDALKKKAKSRVAKFESGGGYATGQGGVSGLGSSNG